VVRRDASTVSSVIASCNVVRRPSGSADPAWKSKIAVRMSWMTFVRLIEVLGQPRGHGGGLRPTVGALHSQADREQPLDDMAVQVRGDAVPVGQGPVGGTGSDGGDGMSDVLIARQVHTL
jgi:hypothetical protein